MATKRIKKPKAPKVPETLFTKRLIFALRSEGCYVWKQNVVTFVIRGRLVSSGIPEGASDLVCLWPGGITLFIECKSNTGKQRDTQVRFQQDIESRGHVYILATPNIPLEETVELIKQAVKDKCQQIANQQVTESLSPRTSSSKHSLTLKLL